MRPCSARDWGLRRESDTRDRRCVLRVCDVEGKNLAGYFAKEVRSALWHQDLVCCNAEMAEGLPYDAKEPPVCYVAKDIDTAIDAIFGHVETEGTKFGQVDEQGVGHLEDRRERSLSQHHLNRG